MAYAHVAHDCILGNNVIIANAGINGPTKPAWEYSLAEWNRVLAVDLTGVFISTQQCIRHMRERGTGRVVIISSVAGKEGNPGACAYGAAKAGVIGFAKGLARELLPSEITVNCVAPGFIATDMTDAIPEDQQQMLLTQVPAGRLGEPDEIADVVAFLAGDSAGYITGETINVNGGMYMS